MLSYVMSALAKAKNCEKPIVVVGHKAQMVRDFVGDTAVCIEQTELSGTATAVKSAMSAVPDTAAKIFIIYGDNPFITAKSVKAIEKAHDKAGAIITLATAKVDDFLDWRSAFMSFGRIVRDPQGEVAEIVEYKNATEHERGILEINPGFYCVDAVWLKSALSRIEANPLTGEYYLTDLLSLAIDDSKKVASVAIAPEEAFGVNSQEDAQVAETLL